MTKANFPDWSLGQASKMYGVDHWGNDYFSIDQSGNVVVKNPQQGAEHPVPIMDIVQGMQDRDLQMPVLLRIENILDESISSLNDTFADVIEKVGYQNKYQGVYPIKVNQQAQIVEEIAQFGARYNHGFEVGSKAEMVAALSTIEALDSLIICNGYKDQEFIDLGLEATKLGFKCFFVVETLTELPIIVKRSEALGVKPLIGVRTKMTSQISGHWGATSGERSVFGLSSNQLIEAIDYLKEHQMLDCLQLLHCHLGSQIPNIRDIRSGVLEACRYYTDLCKEGAALTHIDLGGGLAVDYTGLQSSSGQSRNYSLAEYCEDIIDTIKTTLDAQSIAHPVIVTESGRATVAYTSILLFNILDTVDFDAKPVPNAAENEHSLIANMREISGYLKPQRVQECFNDAQFYRDEIRELFKRGQIDLRTRSVSETLYFNLLHQIKAVLADMPRIPEELEGINESLADIYYGNFSLFQSLPDSWAIDQLFPIMPIHRLHEKPNRQAILADITCDCDGKIEQFLVDQQIEKTIPLHDVKEDQEYYLGVFLVGAYQETLGDLHNLFGDTNVVSVRLNADGSYDFVKEVHGDSIEDVLSYVEYQPHQMKTRFRNTVEAAVKDGRINARERQQMIKTFNASMQGYTYYEKEELSENVNQVIKRAS
ncbi:biosynthetic arginine decarboxylase [Catenovulum sp. SM1970]|uniref:biosynthetic arginine decarboxylase n=1 Tax=Marinifaba aquimaris TaxID=2741323 RepID=UPI0015735C12|nr:biosynthetic arginine decarboxylase [Marinifaba aquimaris]NTS78830.1 biosynthetic arginine decarboxylase [Marinifaba aquimaris]